MTREVLPRFRIVSVAPLAQPEPEPVAPDQEKGSGQGEGRGGQEGC